jgi:hypothetical protein
MASLKALVPLIGAFTFHIYLRSSASPVHRMASSMPPAAPLSAYQARRLLQDMSPQEAAIFRAQQQGDAIECFYRYNDTAGLRFKPAPRPMTISGR